MFKVEKIKLQQLPGLIASNQFAKFENKPISSLRAASYSQNPYALPEDVVLYMAFDNDILIGYRSIWRDVFYEKGKSKEFGWLSGNWVHENYRRKGVSTLLFNEVFKDWKGALMYTNYAANSKLLYDKTDEFKEIKSLIGIRFYIRCCLEDVLIKKHKVFFHSKWLLFSTDKLVNAFLDIRYLFLKDKEEKVRIEKDEVWDTKIESFLRKYKNEEFFKREALRYGWVKNYPWISENRKIKEESNNYFFSLYAKEFQNNYYTFYNTNNELKAIVWLSIRDGHLKIPYVYFENEMLESIIDFLVLTCKQKKLKTVLVYNKDIEEVLCDKIFFLRKKTFYQKFFATKTLNVTKECAKIQSGDGDVIFT